MHWPEPALAEPVAHDRGPVMVTVDYRIRGRTGPPSWRRSTGCPRSAAATAPTPGACPRMRPIPERIVEWFFVESWAEHLRQHRRVSKADADIQAEARRFHQGPDAPVVAAFPGARTAPADDGPAQAPEEAAS